MNQNEINDLISRKSNRYQRLTQKKEDLEKIDLELSIDKIGLTIRSVYYFIKRLLLIIMGFVFLVSAVVLITQPRLILNCNEDLKHGLTEAYSKVLSERIFESVGVSLQTIVENKETSKLDAWIEGVVSFSESFVEKEILTYIIFIGGLFFVLALFLFYISRLTKQLRKRNKSIAKADAITQELIKDFKEILEEEKAEVDYLKTYMNKPL